MNPHMRVRLEVGRIERRPLRRRRNPIHRQRRRRRRWRRNPKRTSTAAASAAAAAPPDSALLLWRVMGVPVTVSRSVAGHHFQLREEKKWGKLWREEEFLIWGLGFVLYFLLLGAASCLLSFWLVSYYFPSMARLMRIGESTRSVRSGLSKFKQTEPEPNHKLNRTEPNRTEPK